MARQTRKIKKKLAPAVEEKNESNSLKPKEGRDRLLLVLMAVTALIMILGYNSMDSIGMGLYSTMMGAMICLYFSRHGNLGEQLQKNLRYASFAFIAAVILLMIANFYYNINWQ